MGTDARVEGPLWAESRRLTGLRLGAGILVGFVVLALHTAVAKAADPVVAAAGDVACDPSSSSFKSGDGTPSECRQRYTSDLLVGAGLAKVLAVGDLQYNSASLLDFSQSYDPSWGRVKSITRPVIGNHEPGSASGYFDYFNGAGNPDGPAGERGKGYYSFDVGSWHLIALNSNCARLSCPAEASQEQWLRNDLAANPDGCKLAFFHHPRFSSGHDGNSTFLQPLWQVLYDAHVDVAVSGHSHDYERFAPQDADGNFDATGGIRQFVVGTGGAFFTGLGTPHANSQVRENDTYGVLFLTLHPTSYDWEFRPEAGKLFTDSGSGHCEIVDDGVPPDTAITAGPSGTTNSDTASFSFSSSEPSSRFECKLDGESWTTCFSPTSYNGLSTGSHTFSVRAIDRFGNRDLTEASRAWTIVFVPPASLIPRVANGPAPRLRLTGRRLQHLGRKGELAVYAECDQPCTVKASAAVSVQAGKVLRTPKLTRALAAGERRKLRLRVSKTAVRRIRRALAQGSHVVATVMVVSTGAGGRLTASRKILLRL